MKLTKDILIAALKRASWTSLQTMIALLPVGARIQEVDWLMKLLLLIMLGEPVQLRVEI